MPENGPAEIGPRDEALLTAQGHQATRPLQGIAVAAPEGEQNSAVEGEGRDERMGNACRSGQRFSLGLDRLVGIAHDPASPRRISPADHRPVATVAKGVRAIDSKVIPGDGLGTVGLSGPEISEVYRS